VSKKIERRKTVDAVNEALWQEVVKHFPKVESGDFPPDLTFELEATLEKMIYCWVRYNDDGNYDLSDWE